MKLSKHSVDIYEDIPVEAFACGKKNNSVVAIFECPGRIEARERHPAAGPTGLNLTRFCKSVNDKNLTRKLGINEKLLPSELDMIYDRDNASAGMMVANACFNVHYKGHKNGKEVAEDKDDICNSALRLMREIIAKKFVFCFGNWARSSYERMPGVCDGKKWKFYQKVVYMPHLSMSYVNSNISVDVTGKEIFDGSPGERADKRIMVYGVYALLTLSGQINMGFQEYLLKCGNGGVISDSLFSV